MKNRKKKRQNKITSRNAKSISHQDVKGKFENGFSTPVIQTFLAQNPISLLSEEQKQELMKHLANEADSLYSETLSDLITALKQHDPVELLSTASFYCLMRFISDKTDLSTDGPYTQADVEVLQSLCLQIPFENFGRKPVFHPCLAEILRLSHQLSESFIQRRYSAFAEASKDTKHFASMQEAARLHTQVLRNWGFPQHMREIIFSMFEPLEHELRSVIGYRAKDFMELIDALASLSCHRAMNFWWQVGKEMRHNDLQNLIKGFCTLTDTPLQEANGIREMLRAQGGNVITKKAFLVSLLHSNLPTFFVFTLDDCRRIVSSEITTETLQSLLTSCSLQFGDLKDDEPEHLLMQSKIHTKPLIRIENNRYFLPISGLFNSYFVEIVESLISADAHLKSNYHSRRAKYLEETLLMRLEAAFPNCLVKMGTFGRTPDGNDFENDCVVIVGPIALVFEAKSERVDDRAKRGAPAGLKQHYKTLVKKPAHQTEQFAKLLENNEGTWEFRTRKHGSYSLDLSAIRRAVCVTVTLDWIPAMTLCWQELIKAGVVESEQRPSINLSLADFILALDVLHSPSQRLHYLWRRDEWERRATYLGDEEDILVYYLSTGLSIPAAGSEKKASYIHLYGNSDHLRNHYMAVWTDEKTAIPKPRRILTSWWSSLVTRIESLDLTERWEILCALLDMSIEEQREFEMRFELVVQKVRAKGNDCGENGLVFWPTLSESDSAIIGFAYRGIGKEERNGRAKGLAQIGQKQSGRKRYVVIGRDTFTCNDPYDFLALIIPDNEPS